MLNNSCDVVTGQDCVRLYTSVVVSGVPTGQCQGQDQTYSNRVNRHICFQRVPY